MSEAAVLSLLACHPHPAAAARRAAGAPFHPVLRRLERNGLVARRGGLYRLTAAGKRELALERALRRSILRALR